MAEMAAVAHGRAAAGRRGRPRGPPRPWRAWPAAEPFDAARRARGSTPRLASGRRHEPRFPTGSISPPPRRRSQDGEALIVDLDGYEGPLHVLLALARNQKVDLLKLSITRLADQYLAFVREARRGASPWRRTIW